MIRRRLDQLSETGLSRLRSSLPAFGSRPSLTSSASIAASKPLSRTQSIASARGDSLGSVSVPILTYPPTATALQLGDELSPGNGFVSSGNRFFPDSVGVDGVIQTTRTQPTSSFPVSSGPSSTFSSRSPRPEEDTREVSASVIADAVLQSISAPLPLPPTSFSAAGAANALPEYTGADLSAPSNVRTSAAASVSPQFPVAVSLPFAHSAVTAAASFRPF